MLNKHQILAADDLRTEVVEVPEWGGSVKVRLLTAAEREEITSIWTNLKASDDVTKGNLTQDAMLLRCTVDDEGKRLFEDGDLPALKGKSAIAIARVVQAAMVLNAMGGGSVEEAVKNSNGGTTADSSSASPASSGAPSENLASASPVTS